MKFSQADPSAGNMIQGYQPGQIMIGHKAYVAGLIISAERIVENWAPSSAVDLTVKYLEALLAFEPQVVLIGTGERQVFPPPELCFPLLERGIGVEIMDTGAACRTYNIINGEGRRVVAGLMVR